MLRELISVFRSMDPLKEMSDDFAEMLRITRQLTVKAGDAFFEGDGIPEIKTWISDQDFNVNKLQISIRKRITAHLSADDSRSGLPYCLLLMSLVKDAERIGDYAKDLCDVRDFFSGQLPEDRNVAELREIRDGVQNAFSLLPDVFEECDMERALDLIVGTQQFKRRCDVLVMKVARSSYDADTAAAVSLGARYYKRIGGHTMNLLSSVIMPLHKVDYFDEDSAAE